MATLSLKPSLKPPLKAQPIPPLQSRNQSFPNANSGSTPGSTPQTVRDPAAASLTCLDSLPTIAGRTGNKCCLVETDIDTFLKWDLDLKRLNKIHGLLWMAGRPLRAQPLHRYKMLGMEMVPTDRHDLHLLKYSNKLILKPLPEYLLDYDFWQTHICGTKWMHESASGFLLSYIWILTTPLDLQIAKDLYIVPSWVDWPWWKDFVRHFFTAIDVNALDQVNERYHFGILRLGRVNAIYRIRYLPTHFVRGYLYGYNRYVKFFQRNFAWVLIVCVLFSLVLSAMQVGSGLSQLRDNHAFIGASYVFVVFCIVSVLAVLAIVGVIFCIIFLYNMVSAIRHVSQEQGERAKLARARQDGNKIA